MRVSGKWRRGVSAWVAIAMVVMCLLPSKAAGQWPPTMPLKNVSVLRSDMPARALLDTMAGFTRALGVRCAYCHVGGETTPFETIDFSSDSNPTKLKAREMMRMVVAINRDHLTKLADRRTPPIVVTCATCHRGIAQPRPLQQVLLAAYDAGGVDSTEAAYRALRTRYYGSAAYDFGEVPLADVAGVLQERSRLADAVRLYKLNIAFSPQSGFALRQASNALLATGDTAAAIATLERALVVNAKDSQAKSALERLKKTP